MSIVWPEELQQILNQDGFQLQMGKTTIETEMDVGMPKVRRRSTRPIDIIQASIDITYSEYADLKLFYNTTTNGGVEVFTMDHPITGEEGEFRMSSPPVLVPMGGGKFKVSFTLEVQP